MTQGKSGLGDLAFRAEGGDAGAQYRLGVIFLLGEAAEQDTEAAYRWLVRAADSGNEGARALVEKLIAGKLVSFAEEKERGASRSSGVKAVLSILGKGFAICRRTIGHVLRLLGARSWMAWNRDLRRRFSGTRFQPEVEPLQAAAHGNQAAQVQHPS